MVVGPPSVVHFVVTLPTGFAWRRAAALLSLVAYLLMWGHQALVQHVHCSAHDHFAHAAEAEGPESLRSSALAASRLKVTRAEGADSQRHDGCGHWALLPQAVAFGAASIRLVQWPATEFADFGWKECASASRAVLLYAPKTSPPASRRA